MEKIDYEKELALYALNYAKDMILFMHEQLPVRYPHPPMGPITDVIEMFESGKLPWEKKK